MKKKAILFFSFAIIFNTILILLFNGYYSQKCLQKFLEMRKEEFQREVKNDFKVFDALLHNIEQKMVSVMDKEIMEIYSDLKKKPDMFRLSPQELKKIALKHHVDEIYLINKEGTIVNTSFLPDMEFNLFSAGEDFANFLKSIYGKGKIFHQRIAISNKTGILNMYAYYSPPQSDYVLEISVRVRNFVKKHFSEEYYHFVFHDLFANLDWQNKFFYKVRTEIAGMSDVSCWSLLHEGIPVEMDKEKYEKLLKEKILWEREGTHYRLYFIPNMKKADFNFVKELFVIREFDVQPLYVYFKNIFLLILLSGFLSIIVSILVSTKLFERLFYRRMLILKEGLEKIANGDYETEIKFHGKDEMVEIAENVNSMKEKIKTREEEIRKREEFNYALFEYNPIETIVVDKAGKVVMYNLAVKMNRKSSPKIGSVMYKDYASLHKTDMFAEMMDCIRFGKTKVFENAVYDGNRYFHITIVGFSAGAIITSQEVTDKIYNQKRIEFLNETLKAIRNVNQLITKTTECGELIEKTCETLTETKAYISSWIIVFDENRKVLSSASSGWGREFEKMVENVEKGNLSQCCIRAIKQSEPIIETDTKDCNGCPLVKGCKGLSIYVIRLENENKVYGLFSVTIPREIAMDEENISLFKEVAGDLSFALKKMELEKQQAQNIKAIESSLQENVVLLQEVHHRVKNNMQLIISLLRLQSKSVEDEKTRELFRDSLNRVYSMALIHEKLYKSDKMTDIDFLDYIEGLSRNLFLSFGASHVKLELDIEKINLNINTAIPLGLIVNEMLSNSLKYAFPDGKTGKIRIVLKRLNDSEFLLSVSDEGVGFPDNFDISNIDSMGLQLIKTLSKQLKADLKISGENGVSYTLRFAMKK